MYSRDEYDITDLIIESPVDNKASRNKPSIPSSCSEKWSNHNRKYITTRNGKKLYYLPDNIHKEDIRFELEEDFSTTDSNVSGANAISYIIYPQSESWIGVDQSTADIDPHLYDKFMTFLKEYFTEDLSNFWSKYENSINTEPILEPGVKKTKKQRNSTDVEDKKSLGLMNYAPEDGPRAIPGGRYGCAQFIKT